MLRSKDVRKYEDTMAKCEDTMATYERQLRLSAYEEPTVLWDSAAERLVKILTLCSLVTTKIENIGKIHLGLSRLDFFTSDTVCFLDE